MPTNNSPIIARVCKHASYNENKFERGKDLTCAKITNIHEDGSRSDQLIALENYKQPFWIVKQPFRKFKQYKDYIEESKCKEYRSARCQIGFRVSQQLFGGADRNATIRDARTTPYVFGLDQTPPVHLKQRFFDKYTQHQEREVYTIGAYDVETCMFSPSNPIIMASVTKKKVGYFAAVRSWFKGASDEEIFRNLKEAENKYLKEHLDRRECVIEYALFDTPGQVAKANIDKFHEYAPDWIISWNALYDMEKTERALVEEGYKLPDVYSDPSIPPAYRHYKLEPGRTHKIKENGDRSPLEPQERFPTVRTMAKWQWFDGMSAYAIKRFAMGKLEGYSLDFTAAAENIPGKLYTEEGRTQGPGSPQWHRHMQKHHPYLYCMYNICDNFVIEEIDEKTSDYSLSLPLMLSSSELHNYVSQPNLISDKLSSIARERGYVWGSIPAHRDKTISDALPTLGNWIALLDTEKIAYGIGKPIFDGLSDVYSQGREDTSDIDVEGAYPTGTLTQNVSNKTTMMEVFQIQGADPLKFREIAINYASSPEANAVQLCEDLFRFPNFDNVKAEFEKILLANSEGASVNDVLTNPNNVLSKLNN